MVFFTCNACGESLKKNQVEKHYSFRCRSCSVLTCIDCHKDFPGDSYKEHIKCISEEEKYSAKGWQPKANANKGAKKQQAWIDNLQALMNDAREQLDDDVRKVLDVVMRHENIPRKKPKFINFVKNIIRGIRPATIDKTWEVFEEAHKSKADNNDSVQEEKPRAEENGKKGKKRAVEEEDEDGEEETKTEERMGVKMFKGLKAPDSNLEVNGKSKKRKAADDGSDADCPNGDAKRAAVEEEEEAENGPAGGKFDWEEAIAEILRKKGEMKVNKLKKRVVDEYMSRVSTHKTQEALLAKVDKKLKKNKCFKVSQDKVTLVKRE